MVDVSWVTLDRVVSEDKPKAKRPLRSHFAGLTDDGLLAGLRKYGIDTGRDELAAECRRHVSAEALTLDLDQSGRIRGGADRWATDSVWAILLELWLRWFPEIPVFERLDDQIALGYRSREEGQEAACCEVWLRAWAESQKLFEKTGSVTVEDFDKKFRGTQSLYNWMQDLESVLWEAGLTDPAVYEQRIRVCEDILRMLPPKDQITIENTRRSLTETHFELGRVEHAEAMFRQWLEADPQWGWGWVAWAECYQFTHTDAKDLGKAAEILLKGLTVAGVRERSEIENRLCDVYRDQGRIAEADDLAARMREEYHQTLDNRLGRLAGLQPLRMVKTGRNEPCPCGTGKKYKKCCGK